MKAAIIREYGAVEKIEVADVPVPEPAAGEAAVRVRAAALNHLDIWVRKGSKGGSLDHPLILGSDAAGVVSEVGGGVGNVKPGDEVILNPGLSCGQCEFCRRGEQSTCPDFGLVGLSRPGTFAEMVAVPAGNLAAKPEYLSFAEAAALSLDHVTAWRMLFTRAELRPGETVLIHGIGGGVAMAGLQFAVMTGAETIVTSSSDEKLAKATDVGAHYIVNYHESDVAETVMDLTGGRGVDVCLDSVGAATWPVDFAVVRRGGRIVLCGITTGAEAAADLQKIYWNQVSVLGSTMGSDEDYRCMVEMVRASELRPVVDAVFPLEQVREATARMEEGEQCGKIALTVA